jgi:hypothetical protein
MLRHLMSAREICWRAASKTRRTRHAIVCDDVTRRTTRFASNTAHTTTPPEDETECPACSEPTQTPGRSSCAPLGGRLGDGENLSVDPGMAAAIKEWNTVYKDQAPHARVQTHSKDLTNSERQGGCGWKVDQHTASRFARNSLLAPDPRAQARTSRREKTAEQTMEVEKRPPTRRAEDPLPPAQPPTAAHWPACSHATVGMTSLARFGHHAPDAHTQRSDPNRKHDFASRTVDLFRAVTLAHRHAPKSQRPAPPQVDGRIMSVLKQHLTQERYAPHTAHGHPLTY